MSDTGARRLCEKLGVTLQQLQRHRVAAAPDVQIISDAVRASAQATTGWFRWIAIVNFGATLLPWLTRQRIEATMIAAMGGPPVKLTFSVGHAESDNRQDYELQIEPTVDIWLRLVQSVGLTSIPIMEGNASPLFLMEVARYVRILTKRAGRGKGRFKSNYERTTSPGDLRPV